LRERVRFMQVNLTTSLPHVGTFDAIFLRNLLIYFDADIKRQVVGRVLSVLKPHGRLYVGHSETLNGVAEGMRLLAPSVYRKE